MPMQNRESKRDRDRLRMILAQAAPNFLDPSFEWRRIFAEMWGTFLLVFSAAGGGVVSAVSSGEVTRAMTVIAPGLMVMAIIYFMGTVSGAHLNPAVTLAFAVRRNFPWARVPAYIAAQLAGGTAAVWFLKALFGMAGNLGATVPGNGINPMTAFAMETVLTAGLVNTILGTASGARNIGSNGAIAVGGYIVMAHLWSFPVSGTSMNPVRSLAPDILRNNFGTTWVYIAGPLAGAMIGVFFEWILKGAPTEAGAIVAQGTLEFDERERKGDVSTIP
ncbi:MAG: aquaporin [Chlorobiaceae bacterium]|nr:aquaporin [Chlorobiaceae bacterium]